MKKIIRKFIKEQIKTLSEYKREGNVASLHYRFDQVDNLGEIKKNLKSNPILNQNKIKVEFGEDDGNSFDVKFTIEDITKTAAMTAIRLLRDRVLEPIEKANKAVIIDIEPDDFKPKIDYDQMAQQSAMDDRRQQGMDPGLEEAARELGYLDEIGNFHDPRMSSGNFDHLTPEKEEQDSDVKSINMVYTDDGRFYGFNMYSEPGLKGKRVKLSYIEEVNKFLQSKGIETEIPEGYNIKILNSIVADLKKQKIEAQHNDYMDVSEGDPGLEPVSPDDEIYGDDDKDNFPDFEEAYTSEWDPETAAKNQEYIKKSKKERELKAARAAFEKAEMNGDIRGQELALAAIDLIKNGPMKGLSKPSGLKEMASELGYLGEEKSSLFSQSLIDDVKKKVREITGILEDGYNENVGYQEYKFEDGTGGFAFKWTHARNWGGRLNLSLNENGNHTIETLSYYDDKVFSNKTKFKSVQTWKDLSDDDLFNIFRILQPSLKKNEMLAKKALSDEASAQSDYYANKPNTGRIGYGLSQQPRKRN